MTDDEVLAFELGHEVGMHPLFGDGRTAGAGITTTLSRWLGLTCTTCRHTFRVGDRVETSGWDVRHLDPVLNCGTPADHGTGDGENAAAFARGLLEAWPAASGEPVRLSDGDWRLPRRGPGGAGPTCPVCAHTFRPGDMVIVCPCARPVGASGLPPCELAVHRDPVSGLTCWDDWRPDGRLVRCPITHEVPG
ncbi:hypothetical protein [Actinoplanes derwentensis]|uniref:Uncharacterized protein n=1 Tax=Actinoplanes derwentensis TaxID=113562 RepID=A0A1H2AIS0_9ACTN|nr:hypothetical protein [Actinoplanes derwentensis]GID90306.1 hypothetical protein Ade03nite_92300 [Actinoplanes derwentensis]SDT45672.1 hypothetical protein SAMN04489716_3882 [Actinoplanes derwentensis]